MDLVHGYLQMPLNEEARAKTAFITPDETGEFTRAIFGLMNAPFYSSKLMQLAMGPLRGQVALFYLDDILIPGKDWTDLMTILQMVLEALRKAKLTIKLSKCEFGTQEWNTSGSL
ncbi:Reverse transcriptase (RNA-dependent DNA polymerase) [Popillia japonica]|uniref:Reverse transcriptase (RNA-dependent DNA polymerase) n=1 Tax=Popillia japonica TaxID=7064 RepID=A0AAW1IS26_POPJA